jgi:hypothetical protein
MRRKLAPENKVLEAVVTLADDGFCLRRDLVPRFRGLGERDLRRSVARAVRQGLLLERRGSDGRLYVAVSGEGWESLRRDGWPAQSKAGSTSRS